MFKVCLDNFEFSVNSIRQASSYFSQGLSVVTLESVSDSLDLYDKLRVTVGTRISGVTIKSEDGAKTYKTYGGEWEVVAVRLTMTSDGVLATMEIKETGPKFAIGGADGTASQDNVPFTLK
ncbi:MAG: hypothetical protein LBH66_06235 [Oscillospiraceae bacterium]|jgi:hypothetical protein|nr:hypothetical protein [Oscillospiraceae bacterium]